MRGDLPQRQSSLQCKVTRKLHVKLPLSWFIFSLSCEVLLLVTSIFYLLCLLIKTTWRQREHCGREREHCVVLPSLKMVVGVAKQHWCSLCKTALCCVSEVWLDPPPVTMLYLMYSGMDPVLYPVLLVSAKEQSTEIAALRGASSQPLLWETFQDGYLDFFFPSETTTMVMCSLN